jgi:hypothetical protein
MVPAAPVAAQRVHYEGSLNASTGRYIFSERTTGAVWTNGLSLTLGRLAVRGSVPVWWQNTVLVTVSGVGPIPSGGGGERSRAVSDTGEARRRRGAGGQQGPGSDQKWGAGATPALAADSAAVPIDVASRYQTALGDPLASANLRIVDGRRVSVTVGAGAKIPVADTAHFGTGKWDVGGSASISVQPAERTLIGLDVSFWHLGDLAELNFRDPVSAGLSISRLFRSGWGGMVTGSASTTALEGFPGPASVGAGMTRFRGNSAMGFHLSAGLSDTSPDVCGGFTWRIGF